MPVYACVPIRLAFKGDPKSNIICRICQAYLIIPDWLHTCRLYGNITIWASYTVLNKTLLFVPFRHLGWCAEAWWQDGKLQCPACTGFFHHWSPIYLAAKIHVIYLTAKIHVQHCTNCILAMWKCTGLTHEVWIPEKQAKNYSRSIPLQRTTELGKATIMLLQLASEGCKILDLWNYIRI